MLLTLLLCPGRAEALAAAWGGGQTFRGHGAHLKDTKRSTEKAGAAEILQILDILNCAVSICFENASLNIKLLQKMRMVRCQEGQGAFGFYCTLSIVHCVLGRSQSSCVCLIELSAQEGFLGYGWQNLSRIHTSLQGHPVRVAHLKGFNLPLTQVWGVPVAGEPLL